MAVLDFKSVGERASAKRFQAVANTEPIGIKTPVRLGNQSDGLLAMHFDIADQIQDNLKNLILTNKGERLGRFDFGANLRELSFMHGHDSFDSEAILRIKEAIDRYMPFVDPKTFESKPLSGLNGVIERVDIRIVYDVPRLQIVGRELIVTIFVRG